MSRRGRRTSKAVSQLPYALTKIQTAAASAGSWFIISPSPSSGETHLAPCWTFIRPDSHQMVPGFGSGAAWSSAGGGCRISAQLGAQIGAFLSARCQGSAEGAGDKRWCTAPLYVGILWHETFGKEKAKFLNPSSLFLNLPPTENKMEEGEKNPGSCKQKWNASNPHLEPQQRAELTRAIFFFFFLTSGL